MKRYLPFLTGVYTTSPGLSPLSRDGAAAFVFDIDEHYDKYLSNKKACRSENLTKYHIVHQLSDETSRAVNSYLIERMQLEYPAIFQKENDALHNATTGDRIFPDRYESPYTSAFDTICSQLQEDVAVVQLQAGRDWLAAIHLCSPNHWDPRRKIGRPFHEVHSPVPDMERTIRNYQVMLQMIVDKEPFTRFAWGIATDERLNHHPEAPEGVDVLQWRGRRTGDVTNEYFIRTERQTLIGLKDVGAFIFAIRTYFYRVADLSTEERVKLKMAVQSMSRAALEYKGMVGFYEDLLLRIT